MLIASDSSCIPACKWGGKAPSGVWHSNRGIERVRSVAMFSARNGDVVAAIVDSPLPGVVDEFLSYSRASGALRDHERRRQCQRVAGRADQHALVPEALLEDVEGDTGLVKISKRKADRIINWEAIMKSKKEGDPVSGKVTKLAPTVPGVFFARTAHRHLLRGMAVGKIAGAKAFRAGKLLSQ